MWVLNYDGYPYGWAGRTFYLNCVGFKGVKLTEYFIVERILSALYGI